MVQKRRGRRETMGLLLYTPFSPCARRLEYHARMPIYEYAPSSGKCKRCHGRFEVYQKISEGRLAHCPDCGKRCERVISAAAVHGKYSTSNSRVKELGMTKYKKSGDGVYERVAGSSGPQVIRRGRK